MRRLPPVRVTTRRGRIDTGGVSPRFITPALLLRKSDAELVALVAAGHDAAFTAIVVRHRAHLLRHCRSLLRDQRAEDALQQTFLRALQSLRSGGEVRELRPWLHQIARNVALTELTTGKREHAELNDDWEDRSRTDEYDRRVALRETLLAVDALPDRQRAALLRSAAGESPDAIGRELGVTSMAVRQLVHRARVSVRAAVRVICPPPLIWLSRRVTAVLEKIPRAAGAPAGAAPAASKIAVAVVVSATVAAPATVIHSILTHHPRPVHRSRLVASRPVAAASHSVGRRPAPPSSFQAPPAPAVVIAPPPRMPSVAHAVRPRLAVAAPPRAPSARKPSSRASSGGGVGVSAWSPGSAPVGSGSGPGSSSAGAPIDAARIASAATESSGSTVGPTASASASSPTDASATPADSSSSTAASTDASSPDQSATAGSTDASGTTAAGSATSP